MTIAILYAVTAILILLPGVMSYSNGATSDSCYSLLPRHHDNDQVPPPSVNCNSEAAQCNGLTLTVTRNGISDGYYSCDAEHQSMTFILAASVCI